ncbi:hypothetical protein Tco_1076351, partial [Tanacetum coccineum]
ELSERAKDFDTLEFLVVKYSSFKGLNSKSNSCSDGASMSAEGEIFGTSVELEAKDVKVFERRFSVINDVIWCLFVSGDDERSVLGVTCSCVRGVDFWCSIPFSLKYAWSVLFKNYVPLSVRTVIT